LYEYQRRPWTAIAAGGAETAPDGFLKYLTCTTMLLSGLLVFRFRYGCGTTNFMNHKEFKHVEMLRPG
ncbi:MAG: hypothetical protein IKA87_00020, partial [Lentisphaeria bacterium]|nr:hypothetical protein [Lentisphaeria bacterium]